MRGSALSTLADTHPGKSLAARGAAMRTFGSFAIALALTLLCLGIYIIEDEFANPLAAQPVGLFAAAFILATAVILLYYLIQPRKNRRHGGVHRRCTSAAVDRMARTARATAIDWCERGGDLPFQRCYVDSVRIRPRR